MLISLGLDYFQDVPVDQQQPLPTNLAKEGSIFLLPSTHLCRTHPCAPFTRGRCGRPRLQLGAPPMPHRPNDSARSQAALAKRAMTARGNRGQSFFLALLAAVATWHELVPLTFH